MAIRLGSDDLEFLARVHVMGQLGRTEEEIAAHLGTRVGQLRRRLLRIRSAVEALERVGALVSGEREPLEPQSWAIHIEERASVLRARRRSKVEASIRSRGQLCGSR